MYLKAILKIKLALLFIVCSAYVLHAGRSLDIAEFNKAKLSYVKADYKTATAGFESLLEKNVGKKLKNSVYLYLGRCYKKTENFDKALSIYQLAVELYPKDEKLLTELGGLYYDFELFDRAKTVLKQVIHTDPLNFEANKYLAFSYESSGFLDEALTHYEVSLQNSYEKTPMLWHRYGVCLYKKRVFKKAEDAVNIALKLEPDNTDFLLTLSKIYYDSGDFGNGLKIITKAVKLNPHNKEYLLTQALWFVDKGETKSALKTALSILKKEPQEPLALLVCGLSYMKENKPKAALHYFDKIPKIKNSFISKISTKITDIIKQQGDA